MTQTTPPRLYFSDYFQTNPKLLEKHGAFNISLVTDLPLFVDPFLLWNSKKRIYQQLHKQMIQYLRFLRDKSKEGNIKPGLLQSWFKFSEVEQNWLGFSINGNKGRGLGNGFAWSLYNNLGKIFSSFGKEQITQGSHLEKLCLIKEGIGKDNISDFATNLIKGYLLDYTEMFAKKYIDKRYLQDRRVDRVRFNYQTQTWESKVYRLPIYNNDFVLLTPKDLLTKDDTWINKSDLNENYGNVEALPTTIPNEQLRAQVEQYLLSQLPKDKEKPTSEERNTAVLKTLQQYPELIDYYIWHKEKNGKTAVSISSHKVKMSHILYVDHFRELVNRLNCSTKFYGIGSDTYEEVIQRTMYLKQVIENNDGYKLLYADGEPIKKETDIHLLYKLAWFGSPSDVNSEVNNGRGPVDFKISRGSQDKTLVEFKLASNTQLKRNLENQLKIYEKANNTNKSVKVIFFFSEEQEERVREILESIKMDKDKNIILIDARNDNKPSASKAS